MPDTKKLVIQRGKWLRGLGPTKSKLYRKRDDKMCCLGFWCEQHEGLTKDEMRNVPAPHQTKLAYKDGTMVASGHATALCRDLMKANDAPAMSEPQREAEIAHICMTNNIEVEFV